MSEGKEVSIKDVAQKAGVSPTTVSRVINKSDHPVNAKTAERVKEVIDRLNYEPNRMAQGLKKNKSRIIGVIVHDISDSYFSEMVKGIEAITFGNNYIVNICNTERDVQKEINSVKMLKANRAEAVILAGGNLLDSKYSEEMKELIPQLKKQGCCVLGVTDHPFDIVNIELGNERAGFDITEYLINRGHKNIAFIDGPPILQTTRQRFRGFKQALKEYSITWNSDWIFPGDFTFEGGRKAAYMLEKYASEITAVVASNDEAALGLMWQLKQNGFKVPEDFSVTGIGNISSSRYSDPPLTTVDLPLYRLGKSIGNYILQVLQDGDPHPLNGVDIYLKQRCSTTNRRKEDV
ncbi:MAG: LacI family DNA-binding transcriptional regulator [Bacillota bacterium]